MEASKEVISVRSARLSGHVLGKNSFTQNGTKPFITREGLFDALTVLYDECNTESLKRSDKYIAGFVDKFRNVYLDLKKLRVNISDFEVKKVIGRGHFGEVHVVREKQTGDVYAMKTIRKSDTLNQQNACYEEERDIMASTQSNWLTNLQYAFQDTSHLYLIMEFHPGGDLLGLLERQGGKLSESTSTFYLCELVQAVNVLHSMGFVHRDVKPDNVLLDRCGHLKLADFGSAAKLNTKGVVSDRDVISIGTPDYIAPEVLQSVEKSKVKKVTYGSGCDYWSLGILAYELTIGNTPFSGTTVTATYNKIINHNAYLKFPNDVALSENYVSLIRSLLCDQNSRLSYKQILDHALFKEVDWTALHEQVPPFVPKVNGVDDTSNFVDIQSKKSTPSIENFKTKTQFSGRNLPFIGFTFMPDIKPESTMQSNVSMKKNDDTLLENKKKQVEQLQKQLAKVEYSNKDFETLEKKFEDNQKRMDGLENIRSRLEKDLAAGVAEISALRRTLDLERRERKELENRALELIKSAKLKWEFSEKERIEKLNEEIEKQTTKITELCTVNNELTSKLERFEIQFRDKNAELDALQALQLEHKDSLAKARAFSRRSVAGVENKLERITSEAQTQICTLQSKVAVLNENNIQLEEQVKVLKKREQQFEEKCKSLEEQKNHFKKELDGSLKKFYDMQQEMAELKENLKELGKIQKELGSCKKQISELKSDNKCAKLEDALMKEKNECLILQKQLKELHQSMNDSMATQESTFKEKQVTYSTDLKELKDKIKTLTEEREILQHNLQELQERDTMNRIKVEGLEQLLSRLENGVSKLESSSEREIVLQEQVDRLEAKIKELHENSALEKQELRTTNTNLWRKEKELSNCELDKRILQRELKTAEEEIKVLSKDIKKLNETLNIQKETHEDALKERNKTTDELIAEINKLTQIIRETETSVENYKNKFEESQKNLYQANIDVENICEENIRIKNEIQQEINTRLRLEKQLDEVREDNIKLHCNRDQFRQNEETVRNELKSAKRDNENMHLNLNMLRDTCSLLENQLEEYERLTSSHELKERKLTEQITKAHSDLEVSKSETKSAKQSCNEEKSLRLLTETKCKHLAEDVDLLKRESAAYKAQVLEYKDLSTQLHEDLSISEERANEIEMRLRTAERLLEKLQLENKTAIQESSKRLMHLHQMRETNYKINQELSDAKDYINTLHEKITEMNENMSEQAMYFKQREMKSEATIQQQTKLIDFLQSKVEEHKKKKTISDIIFGTSKKENTAPSMALNYKDMESLLSKERETNKKMREEILKLKSGSLPNTKYMSDSHKVPSNPISPKSRMALEQIVRSPSSQQTEFQRKPSFQRMHHNIPHRFESKICIKTTKCGACSESLQIGRTIMVCKECSIGAHNRCAVKVPSTCGLPGEYAKHFSKTLSRSSTKAEKKDKDVSDDFNIQGWVKVPMQSKSCWEKKYACIDDSKLMIYEHQPSVGLAPIEILDLCPSDGMGNVTDNVTSQDCGNIANSDVPFVIKINIMPHGTCWPTKTQLIMLLNGQDKESWMKVLHNIFEKHYPKIPQYTGTTLVKFDKNIGVSCALEFTENTLILGTANGLVSHSKSNKQITKIQGPIHIQQMGILKSLNTLVMIAEESRILIRSPIKHLETLIESNASKSPLKTSKINVNNFTGFHMFEFFDGKNILCTATNKYLFILKFDLDNNEFIPIRMLDTAEPCSCILFTKHSIIVGADKFFEIDLENFEADEFLDVSDMSLKNAINCHRMGSYPVDALPISRHPIEYLLCFKEFGVFTDEFGRRNREGDLKWSNLPINFKFISPFLYVVHFSSVEIIRVTPESNDNVSVHSWICPESIKFELNRPNYLGANNKGVFVGVENKVVFIDGNVMAGNLSVSDVENNSSVENTEQEVSDGDTEFSFNSSVLDRMSSEDGSQKKLRFAPETDM